MRVRIGWNREESFAHLLNLSLCELCVIPIYILSKGWQSFSVKDKIVNILGFVGYTVSVAILSFAIVA